MESISIIGKSKAGRTLALALRQNRLYVLSDHIAARTKKYPKLNGEVLIIAAKDNKIAEASIKAMDRAQDNVKLILHLAGSRPSSILPSREGTMRLTLHPIQTFPEPNADLLEGIYWMASSDTPAAITWAKKFVKDLGGSGVIVLPAEKLALYHAMTVFSSNFVTLLGGAIEEMSESLGQNPTKMKEAVRPLMEQAMENVLQNPAKEVLTGPIRRRDIITILKHQKALQAVDPKLARLYDAFLAYAKHAGYLKRPPESNKPEQNEENN